MAAVMITAAMVDMLLDTNTREDAWEVLDDLAQHSGWASGEIRGAQLEISGSGSGDGDGSGSGYGYGSGYGSGSGSSENFKPCL